MPRPEYTFTVTATNAGGSGPGTDVTVTTEAAPGEVGKLSGAPAGSTAALLQWEAPSTGGTPSQYEVTGSGTIGVVGTTATITDLEAETEYTWTVKAKNSSRFQCRAGRDGNDAAGRARRGGRCAGRGGGYRHDEVWLGMRRPRAVRRRNTRSAAAARRR